LTSFSGYAFAGGSTTQYAEAIANQERLAKQHTEQEAQGFAEKLRALGINPDN
jgi:hypothetical protein